MSQNVCRCIFVLACSHLRISQNMTFHQNKLKIRTCNRGLPRYKNVTTFPFRIQRDNRRKRRMKPKIWIQSRPDLFPGRRKGTWCQHFGNPPTYNVTLCGDRPYFMSKNKQNMRIIRLSRSYCCLKLYYEHLWRDFTTFLTEIKLNCRGFLQFLGVLVKIIPMFREFPG